MTRKTRALFTIVYTLACVALFAAAPTQAQDKTSPSALTPAERAEWSRTLASYDYLEIARAYADFMIEHGRDTYGQENTPLFVTAMNRQTGRMISPPFAHVKRKPFMPGWERDRELRGHDRNYGEADPLDQLTLLKLMHRLSEVTGDKRYAEEADKTAAWWMANTQSPIGLYPWGTHTRWNVSNESGGGTFEFNHVWPYWRLDPEALQKYAMGLWDHYIHDKETGDFNRHAHSHKHGPGTGMEFPWPGSAMIATWVEAYLAKPDPEYVRAISTVLKRWESLRDENGHLAPCSSYGEWAWYGGYVIAANRLDDFATLIEAKEPERAEKMRAYGRRNDAAFLKVADGLLEIKRFGPVGSYLRETGGFDPERLDIIGGPWQDRKDYAGFAVLLHERMKRNDSPELQKVYREAVLDTAEVYMSINPEVQWSVWGGNVGRAMELMLAAHELTGNVAYLHRADHFGRLAVDLFLDEVSPLPKITSHDDFYEIEGVTAPSGDVWMLVALDVQERLARLEDQGSKHPTLISANRRLGSPDGAPAPWVEAMKLAYAENRAGVWDCTGLKAPAASISLAYGGDTAKSLFLSRREKGFQPANGLLADSLEVIASDFINTIPSLEEAKPFNGDYRRKFSGKYREPTTARYGGFKDVLDQAGLLLVNHGTEEATVTVVTTFHDSWDDREMKEDAAAIKPGEQALVAVGAPEGRFIRRIDIASNVPGAVTLDQFAFATTPRSKLNAHSTEPALAPGASPPFAAAEPNLITDGLVLHLTADALTNLSTGSPIGEWRNQAEPKLAATAEGDQRPVLERDGDRVVLKFDGTDDVLTIPDHDALDLDAWTLIVNARATTGPNVILGKIDERNLMMNYRLQLDRDGKVSATVRGESAKQQVNRQARINAFERFALITARFDPKASGLKKVTITVDGQPATYAYENAEGELTRLTHDAPLLIGRQPGGEPRYFQGEIAGILLYNRALSEEELNSTARWLSEK